MSFKQERGIFLRTTKRLVTTIGKMVPVIMCASLLSGTIASADTTNIAFAGKFHDQAIAHGTSALTGPDDITMLGNNIFVGFQNGVGAKGEPSKSGNKLSTVVEYDTKGHVVHKWSVLGKVDGLGTDPTHNRVIATVNEDANSSLFVISPSLPTSKQVQHFTYNVDTNNLPTTNPLATGGGTDSVSVVDGTIYIAASAPSADSNGNFTHSAMFKVTLSGTTATLSPTFMDNAQATDVVSGKPITLNLSDSDSSTVVPSSDKQFGGDLVLDSQGDSELVFVHNPGSSNQSLSHLSIGTQVDDFVWASSAKGTLYVVDSGDNTIHAISGTFKPNTVFVACPSDSGVGGFVGALDLTTGNIQPFAIGFKSPKGLLFVPQK